MTANSIAENIRIWNDEYTWSEAGDEWNGQAAACGVPYAEWKRALIARLVLPYAVPGATILEIAPGHGRWSETLALRAGRLLLVDLSPTCIEYCRQRLGGREHLETFVTDGRSLPPDIDANVDLVWSFDSFVHIAAPDVGQYLHEIHRVLRPGGMAVIHHANRWHATLGLAGLRSLGRPGRLLYRWLSFGPGERADGWRSAVSARSFRRMAHDAGLDVLEQFSRWGAGDRYGVPRHNDRVTVLKKPLETEQQRRPATWTDRRHALPLPGFLGVGSQKAGTTTLHHLLCSHPDVFVPPEKEVHYFSLHTDRGADWYLENFAAARPDQVCGEISPYYLFHPEAPKRIHDLMPDVKLVVLLRDPVERALAGYFHSRRLGLEDLPIEEAFDRETQRLANAATALSTPGGRHLAHQHHGYVARSRYDEQLDRFMASFGRQQLLVLRSEDLFTAPQTVWQRLQGFLELKPRPLPDPMPHANRGGGESAGVDTGFRDRLRSLLSPTYDALERNYGIRW
jgi:ubiquinone/menaquinone biosynthesis C-methylase UbiE